MPSFGVQQRTLMVYKPIIKITYSYTLLLIKKITYVGMQYKIGDATVIFHGNDASVYRLVKYVQVDCLVYFAS